MNFNSLRKEITSNNVSVKELVNDIFAKIDQKDPEINSFICITKDNAIAVSYTHLTLPTKRIV